jgi:hypothetical protein
MKNHLLSFIKCPSEGFRGLFLLLPLWGMGMVAIAQSHINIAPAGTTYTETPIVKFRVSWDSIPNDGKTHHTKIWVMVDYCKVEHTQVSDSWTRAIVSGVSPGTVDAGGKGFWLQGGSSYNQEVTALLSDMPAQFNWCVNVTDYPPIAEVIPTGGYLFHGTPPFEVSYDGVTPNTTSVADSALGCITAFSDDTYNPEGIIPSPPAVATTNPADRCGDGAVTLTATASGNTTTANTYTWTVGSAAETTTTANTYSPTVKAGSTTYSVTVTNANDCTGAAATGTITAVAIPPVPNAPTQDGPKCAGTSITFRATKPSGATGLDWTGSVTGQGDTQTTPTTAGNYSAQVRSFLTSGSTTCYSDYSLATGGTITAIPPVPAAPTQDGPKCVGTPITFRATKPSGATDLEWTGSVSGTGTSKQTNSSAGNYSARVRSFLNSGGITCYSEWSGSTQGTINSPAGELQAANACGCASGLTNCSGTCMTTCCTHCMKWTLCSGFTYISSNVYEPPGSKYWSDANRLCKDKGEGWRLPTIEELQCICRNKETISGCCDIDGLYLEYWSSTVSPESTYNVNYYYHLHMRLCYPPETIKHDTKFVKCVW